MRRIEIDGCPRRLGGSNQGVRPRLCQVWIKTSMLDSRDFTEVFAFDLGSDLRDIVDPPLITYPQRDTRDIFETRGIIVLRKSPGGRTPIRAAV